MARFLKVASPLSWLSHCGLMVTGILPLRLGRDGNLLMGAESEGQGVLPGCGSTLLILELKRPRVMVLGQ